MSTAPWDGLPPFHAAFPDPPGAPRPGRLTRALRWIGRVVLRYMGEPS